MRPIETAANVLAASPFNSDPHAIPGLNKFQVVIGYVAWGAVAVLIIALIATGAQMAVNWHHGEHEHTGKLGSVIGGCLIVGGATSIVGSVLGFNLFTATPQAIPGLGKVQTIIGYTAWAAAGACLIGLILAGVRMAMNFRRGESSVGALGGVIAGCLVVGSAATLVGSIV